MPDAILWPLSSSNLQVSTKCSPTLCWSTHCGYLVCFHPLLVKVLKAAVISLQGAPFLLAGQLWRPCLSLPCTFSPSLFPRISLLSWLQSPAILMRAPPPVRCSSVAVHLINNLPLQFFRVNAAILFLTNWKRLVKP